MRCFGLSHAGLVIEHEGASLIVDPGDFTTSDELEAALAALRRDAAPVAGLVITHEHSDHWTPGHVAAIRAIAPAAPILTTRTTAEALAAAGIDDARVARGGERIAAGPFDLEFYGGRHELLHDSIPRIDNLGVRVNSALAWGGDSLVSPPFAAELLGVPIGSPWSNLAQVMNFVLDAAPRKAYLTHDGMLSERGRGLFAQRVAWCLDQLGGELVEMPRLAEGREARLVV